MLGNQNFVELPRNGSLKDSLGLGGKSVQLLQWMISFTRGTSCETGGGTMPRPGIKGFNGAMPVIMPRLGSKSAGIKKWH